jgi:hypothetical protein
LREAVLYDCRRYLDYKGDHAKVVPQWVEDWLTARTHAQDTTHFFHAPSLPLAYSSGKLGDWYPDLLDEQSGHLVNVQGEARMAARLVRAPFKGVCASSSRRSGSAMSEPNRRSDSLCGSLQYPTCRAVARRYCAAANVPSN